MHRSVDAVRQYGTLRPGLPLCLAALLVAALAVSVQPAAAAQIKEERLGDAPTVLGRSNTALMASPDARHVAFAVESDAGWRMMRDGIAGPPHQTEMYVYAFSPNSQSLWYLTKSDLTGNCVVVVDGVSGPRTRTVEPLDVFFSPDGAHYAYRARGERMGAGWCTVLDGKAGPEYADVGIPSFSPVGSRLAYTMESRQGARQVVDGAPGEGFYGVSPATFSRDGKRIAYVARLEVNGPSTVVVDGRRGPVHDDVELFEFSPDGQHLAYVAKDRKKDRYSVVLDGSAAGPDYRSIQGALTFSPDSKHLAYVGVRERSQVVVDGQPGGFRETICPGSLAYTADSQRLIYVGQSSGKPYVYTNDSAENECVLFAPPVFSADGMHYAYASPVGGEMRTIVDGVVGPPFGQIYNITLTRDGRHVSYVVHAAGKDHVVLDGVPGPEADAVWTGNQLTPDGAHLIYVARRDQKWRMVVDGTDGEAFRGDLLGPLMLSERGGIVGARLRDRMFVVVNGEVGPEYDWIAIGPFSDTHGWSKRPHFDADGSVQYVAVRGDDLLRVTHTPAPLPERERPPQDGTTQAG